ncbi:MAG: TonB-dependent receptor [Chitinophagales bacterium]
MKYYFLTAIAVAVSLLAEAQQTVHGHVWHTEGGKKLPAADVSIYIKGTTTGTYSDSSGHFMLGVVDLVHDTLIINDAFYQADTIALQGRTTLDITLRAVALSQVEISSSRRDNSVANVESFTQADLVKDACCNLSETFENSATVDVSYSDAVSGAKEIRMLGLDGVYTQMMSENLPGVRGLGNTFGMLYVPGPWMNSIQVNKGAGSVVNGYEGITGQINVEYKKPQNSDRLLVNFFLNQDVRNELNIITAHKLGKQQRWSYLGALNGSFNWLKQDMNHDHYIDNPLTRNINVLNRFNYQIPKGGMIALVLQATYDDRQGGMRTFNPAESVFTQSHWGLRLTTAKVDAFAKTGFVVKDNDYVGIQYKYGYHHQYGYVGRRMYNATEHFGYVNLIFQHGFGQKNLLKAGLSTQIDNVVERFDTLYRKRLEVVPGAFAEGTFIWGRDEKLTVVGGVRADYHNLYGPFLTPRFNLKWKILYDFSLRLSAGRGYRVPTIFAENFGWLANNRELVVAPDLQYEEAWNYGASLTYKFFLNFREGSISVDYYRTDFTHQVVADMENTRQLQFYNLSGKSFANALQAEISYEPVKRFEVKLAYKFEQNKTDYKEGRKIYPLRPQHRGLVSLQYTTRNKHWRFNSSLNWYGKTRIPSTAINDVTNQRPLQSKDWLQLNAQITFSWKRWEIYAGGENLINFIQKNPIIAGDTPFSNQFDASLVWGPLRGAMAFAGFRFTLL